MDNPENGVFDEATIVNEAAGDVFRSGSLLPGAGPLLNQNVTTRNMPNADEIELVDQGVILETAVRLEEETGIMKIIPIGAQYQHNGLPEDLLDPSGNPFARLIAARHFVVPSEPVQKIPEPSTLATVLLLSLAAVRRRVLA